MFKILIYNKKITNNNLKSFGIIWFLIFLALSFYPLIGNNKINMLSLSASIVFFLISIMQPRILKYFYILWTKLGNFIGYYI